MKFKTLLSNSFYRPFESFTGKPKLTTIIEMQWNKFLVFKLTISAWALKSPFLQYNINKKTKYYMGMSTFLST